MAQHRPGFTLVEIIIVVLILMIVVLFSVPLYNQMQERFAVQTLQKQLLQEISQSKTTALYGSIGGQYNHTHVDLLILVPGDEAYYTATIPYLSSGNTPGSRLEQHKLTVQVNNKVATLSRSNNGQTSLIPLVAHSYDTRGHLTLRALTLQGNTGQRLGSDPIILYTVPYSQVMKIHNIASIPKDAIISLARPNGQELELPFPINP